MIDSSPMRDHSSPYCTGALLPLLNPPPEEIIDLHDTRLSYTGDKNMSISWCRKKSGAR